MKSLPLLGVVFAASLISGAAWAEPGRGAERFAELDSNGDGVITQAEFEAQVASHFAEADSDGNGTLDEDEAIAFRQARREEEHESRRDDRFGQRAGDDNVIDLEEFTEAGMNRMFLRADLDENGEVTETEMRLVAELRHEGGPRGPGGPGGRGGRGGHGGPGGRD